MILHICSLSKVLSRWTLKLVESVFVLQLPILLNPFFLLVRSRNRPRTYQRYWVTSMVLSWSLFWNMGFFCGCSMLVTCMVPLVSPLTWALPRLRKHLIPRLGLDSVKGHVRELISPELERAVIQPIRLIEKLWP